MHDDPTHRSPNTNTYPLGVRYFEKSGTVNMSELLAPLLRKRCSILMYPCKVRSSIARFTVDGDRLRSFAILLTDGQH